MSEEQIYLKSVTGGKNHRNSLVYHFESSCGNLTHEFLLKKNSQQICKLKVGGPALKIRIKFYIDVFDTVRINVELQSLLESVNLFKPLNRSLKFYLGMGFVDMKKLDSEMNRFHSQKLVEETDGLEKGRLNSKRRQTILREKNIAQILTEFEGQTQAQKIDGLQFHLLEIGTLTKDNPSPEYFEVLAPLIEISTETELYSKLIFG